MSRAPQALTTQQAARLEQAIRSLQGGGAPQALAIARAIVAEVPGAPNAQHALALCLGAAGERGDAQRAFLRALELAPEHPLVLGNYGKFLQQSGRQGEALVVLEPAAVNDQPEHRQLQLV